LVARELARWRGQMKMPRAAIIAQCSFY